MRRIPRLIKAGWLRASTIPGIRAQAGMSGANVSPIGRNKKGKVDIDAKPPYRCRVKRIRFNKERVAVFQGDFGTIVAPHLFSTAPSYQGGEFARSAVVSKSTRKREIRNVVRILFSGHQF